MHAKQRSIYGCAYDMMALTRYCSPSQRLCVAVKEVAIKRNVGSGTVRPSQPAHAANSRRNFPRRLNSAFISIQFDRTVLCGLVLALGGGVRSGYFRILKWRMRTNSSPFGCISYMPHFPQLVGIELAASAFCSHFNNAHRKHVYSAFPHEGGLPRVSHAG